MSSRSGAVEGLRKAIELEIAGVDAEWSVFVDLVSLGETIAINADRKQDTMSLIKLAIMVAMMRACDRGDIDLDTRIVMQDDDRRLGTSIISLLDSGLELSLRDALRLMIVVSDNAATDMCLRAIGGPGAVAAEIAALGMEGIEITGDALAWFRALVSSINPDAAGYSPADLYFRGYPPLDPVAYFEARKNYHFGGGRPFSLASARGLVALLAAIHRGEAASAASCAFMRQVLRAQQMQTMLPRYAFGIAAEHKTANFFPFIASDAGIFTAMNGHTAIMSVMTQRYAGHRDRIEETISRIGQLVFTVLDAQAPQPGAKSGS